jgi:hypothetical protein
MLSINIKDTVAKVVILVWIVSLILLAGYIVQVAVVFNINTFFGMSGESLLPKSVVHEVQVILLMFAISITGGVSFMIKDFYRSIKYSNLYRMAWEDYSSQRISFEEFQRLIPIEIYTGRFNYTWIYWFLIQPILSSVLWLIAFFIARSGLGVLQGASSQGDLTIQSLYLYAVLTFLAGFSSHKFIAWLDRLADKIFSTTLPDRFQDTKSQIQSSSAHDRNDLKSTFGLQTEVSESIINKTQTETELLTASSELLQENAKKAEAINSEGFERKSLKSIR